MKVAIRAFLLAIVYVRRKKFQSNYNDMNREKEPRISMTNIISDIFEDMTGKDSKMKYR